MSNVFDKIGDIRNNVNRSTFDWSHANNVTTGIGRITPIFCEELPPNSSLKIKANLGLQFMPMMYPVQTRLKVVTSFFKVPLRTLWKDYMNWISSPNQSSDDLVPPFIAGSNSSYFGENGLFRVSGLADYLGIPVTAELPGFDNVPATYNFDPQARLIAKVPTIGQSMLFGTLDSSNGNQSSTSWKNDLDGWSNGFAAVDVARIGDVQVKGSFGCRMSFQLNGKFQFVSPLKNFVEVQGVGHPIFYVVAAETLNDKNVFVKPLYAKDIRINIPQYVNDTQCSVTFDVDIVSPQKVVQVYLLAPNCTIFTNPNSDFKKTTLKFDKYVNTFDGGVFPLSEDINPYFCSDMITSIQGEAIKLSAFPFRAYEAIYNAYVRNIKNNPFKKNGVAVYNEWITTDEGGRDTTKYDLFRANWYSDMFTTALPSPQQGKAPLVGLTTYSETKSLDNGHEVTEMKYALVDEDGKRYKVQFESNDVELKSVSYSELNENVQLAPYSLVNPVTSGISINDFRNVNAYQRYLELNQFRGYSYKEIVEGRFDVNVKFDALQMPEYLGGFTRDIQMSSVTQTTEIRNDGSYSGALGSQSGLAYSSSSSENISVFADEACIVMGIMYVVPIPIYSQSLPKFFTYRDRLDYFNPEFDHIGYQPIENLEITPIQQWLKDKSQMHNTFGYQRPWYQYCQKNDRACGIFRTELRNFLINRVFSDVPQLGASFTTVDESEVNDVFSVTETSDKIFGQVYFDIEAKLPISRVVVPKLE